MGRDSPPPRASTRRRPHPAALATHAHRTANGTAAIFASAPLAGPLADGPLASAALTRGALAQLDRGLEVALVRPIALTTPIAIRPIAIRPIAVTLAVAVTAAVGQFRLSRIPPPRLHAEGMEGGEVRPPPSRRRAQQHPRLDLARRDPVAAECARRKGEGAQIRGGRGGWGRLSRGLVCTPSTVCSALPALCRRGALRLRSAAAVGCARHGRGAPLHIVCRSRRE